MSKKLAAPDPFAASNGQVLTVDSAEALGVKWQSVAGGSTNVGGPRRVNTGVTWTVPDGFDLIVDRTLVLEGTGKVVLEGDAKIILTPNL